MWCWFVCFIVGDLGIVYTMFMFYSRVVTELVYTIFLCYIVGDLWGPLILCMFMAMMLQSSASLIDKDHTGDGGPEFATFFLIYWVGALIITVNTILLGGTM